MLRQHVQCWRGYKKLRRITRNMSKSYNNMKAKSLMKKSCKDNLFIFNISQWMIIK